MIDKKILVIDDDQTSLGILDGFLKSMGCDVHLSGSAEDALKLLESEAFPVIITDLNMPGMGGIDLCKKIRETNAASVIYALSGYIAQHDIDSFEANGFDGHLAKPADFNIVKKAVRGAFEKIHRTSTIND